MTNKIFYSLIALFLIANALFWVYMFQPSAGSGAETASGVSGEAIADIPDADYASFHDGPISLTMYSSEGCNCCVKWAEYLEENGVEVTVEKVGDLQAVKEEYGVPRRLSACHTAIADGYVIEGHVPVEDIRRLLGEQPEATGVSVPGMPPNSPGMDQPVDKIYRSVLFDDETVTVFNTHR